jgi:hypothetical protein
MEPERTVEKRKLDELTDAELEAIVTSEPPQLPQPPPKRLRRGRVITIAPSGAVVAVNPENIQVNSDSEAEEDDTDETSDVAAAEKQLRQIAQNQKRAEKRKAARAALKREAQSAINQRDVWRERLPINRMNLFNFNKTLKQDIENKTAGLYTNRSKWIAMANDTTKYPLTIEGRLRLEDDLVEEMNLYIGVITAAGESQKIAVRGVSEMRYKYMFKTVPGLKDILKGSNISTIDHKDLQDILNFEEDGKGVQPKFQRSRNGEPILKVRLVSEPIADIWLRHDRRAIYSNTTFNPTPEGFTGCATPDLLNIWGGFEFDRDDLANNRDYHKFDILGMFMNHIRFVWATTDEEYCVILGHFAEIFQRPWIKQGLSISLTGDEGEGKSIIYKIIGMAMKEYFVHIQDTSDMLGQFNASVVHKLLIFCDECLFAGSHADASKLKNLITGDTERVGEKFKDTHYANSYCHIGAASNDEHIVPATNKARRFLVLEALTGLFLNHPTIKGVIKNKEQYFNLLTASMYDDDFYGLKVLVNFFMNLPLDGFDPRKVPISEQLVKQKILSFDKFHAWWCDMLLRGGNSWDFVGGQEVLIWKEALTVQILYQNYLLRGKSSYQLNESAFTEKLLKLLPHHRFMVSTVEEQKTVGKAIKIVRREINYLHIPSLQECRDHFETICPGINMLWGKVAATDSLDVRPETLQKKRADRINSMTETDILNNWLPEDFFGYPLRKVVNEGTFKIRNNKEWDEYIERYRDGDYTNLTEADKSELKKKLSLFKIKRV